MNSLAQFDCQFLVDEASMRLLPCVSGFDLHEVPNCTAWDADGEENPFMEYEMAAFQRLSGGLRFLSVIPSVVYTALRSWSLQSLRDYLFTSPGSTRSWLCVRGSSVESAWQNNASSCRHVKLLFDLSEVETPVIRERIKPPGSVATSTCPQVRVSYEKRNADQCSAARRKSNSHR